MDRAAKNVSHAHVRNTISMFTPSGTRIRMSCRNARSSASRSMRRLWIRSSHRSHVSLPSPSGLFRTGTTRRFVGRDIGPPIATPVRSLINLICWHTLSTFFGSVPESEIRAFCAIQSPENKGETGEGGSTLLDIDHLARRHGLAHVANGEASHLREQLERLDDHGLRRPDLHDGGVARLQGVRLLLLRRARPRVQAPHELLESARDLRGVRVEHR